MNLKSSFLFAKRILFPKNGRPSIARKSLGGAVLCIGISLIPLVVILTVSNGMIEGITERMVSLSSSHIEAFASPSAASEKALKNAAETVERISGVTSAYPMISSSALALFGGKRCGVALRAIPPEIFRKNSSYKKLFEAEAGSIGEFYSAGDNEKCCLIGKGVSEKLGLVPGDKIRLVTVNKNSGKSITPGIHSYRVSAVVSCGYRELDALWLFLPFDEGVKILSRAEKSASVMCETENPFSEKIALVQNEIQTKLGKEFRVYRWDQMNQSQYENFSSTKILLLLIQLLIVLVAAVNISSALIMLVLERRREIAILKSLGASSKGISLSFLLTGLAAGTGGILMGIPAGLFFSVNINSIIHITEKTVNFLWKCLYFLLNNGIIGFNEIHLLDEEYYLKVIPVDIPFGDLFLIGAATLLLSVAVSVIPARKAGGERPLDTLRNSR